MKIMSVNAFVSYGSRSLRALLTGVLALGARVVDATSDRTLGGLVGGDAPFCVFCGEVYLGFLFCSTGGCATTSGGVAIVGGNDLSYA